MSPQTSLAAVAAVPTIQRVLEEFLEARRTLSPVEFRLYQHVIFFLEYCINNRGYRNLDEIERARYERLYHEGRGFIQFFQMFGAEKLLPELGDFSDSFIREEVITSERVTRRAGDVVSDLRRWLAESGALSQSLLDAEEIRESESRGSQRRLSRLARLVSRNVVSVGPSALAPEDQVALDYHLVSRVEPARVWLRVYRSAAAEEIGPLRFPREATGIVRAGWSLRCALGRLRGRWELVELLEIHPRG
jgi:hypothetical protein